MVRLTAEQIVELDKLTNLFKKSRAGLIQYAVKQFLDGV